VPNTIQLGASTDTPEQASDVTTSYWIDRTNEFCRSILGNSAQLNTSDAIVPTVNIASTCNAYYTGNTINFYSAGGGCANTAFSTVIAHEWGHGLDERYGGISNTVAEGVSEAIGDFIGMYLVDSPLLGSGFQTAGVALRRGDNTNVYPFATTSPHGAGQVLIFVCGPCRAREALPTLRRAA
jgi:Zn-dependent metalloprotease